MEAKFTLSEWQAWQILRRANGGNGCGNYELSLQIYDEYGCNENTSIKEAADKIIKLATKIRAERMLAIIEADLK